MSKGLAYSCLDTYLKVANFQAIQINAVLLELKGNMRHDWLCSQSFPEEQKQEQRLPGAHWNDQVFQGAFFFALSFAVVTLRPHRVVRVTFLVLCSPLQTPLTESLIEFTDPAMNRVAADLFLCKFSPSVVFSYINNFLIFFTTRASSDLLFRGDVLISCAIYCISVHLGKARAEVPAFSP